MSFNDINNILKQIELDLRGDGKLSRLTYKLTSEMSDWEHRITTGFIVEVNLAIQRNDQNFVFKKYDIQDTFKNKIKKDLFIACLKRDQRDTIITDVTNRLVIPEGISYEYFEVWGMQVEKARNFAVSEALKKGCSKLLFIDDDMIVENTALVKLWETMQNTNRLVVAADYQKKADYEITAHGKFYDTDLGDHLKETDLCAMGFTLINLDEITKIVPMPLFWVFAAPDGYWSMGEDAFFSQNMIEYTKEKPLIDLHPSVLHYDKIWKRIFGKRDSSVTYATNELSTFEKFDFMRQPPVHPLINICIPTRLENDPIATNLERLLLLRGYRSELTRIHGLTVDEARNQLASNSVKMGSEFLLFIDDDVILPESAMCDMLEVMEADINHEIGAVTGDYLLKGKVPHSAFLQLNNDGIVTELNRIKDLPEILDSNWLIGLGCCLIRTEVFRQIRSPWFTCYSPKLNQVGIAESEGGGVNEDASISELLFMNGYKIKILTNLKCLHVDFKYGRVYGYQDKIDTMKFACFPWLDNVEYISIDKV